MKSAAEDALRSPDPLVVDALRKIIKWQRAFERQVQDMVAALREGNDLVKQNVDEIRTTQRRLRDVESMISTRLSASNKHIRELQGRVDKLDQRFRRNIEDRRKAELPYAQRDGLFFRVAEPVFDDGRTLLGFGRLYVLWQVAKNVHHLGLPVMEVGAYRGGSARFLASAFRTLSGEEHEVYVCDTFEGHPADKISSSDPFQIASKFSDTSEEAVRSYLSDFSKVTLLRGEVSAVLPGLVDRQYGFVHLDLDLYRPTLDCLRYFASRLAPGGAIVVDDYQAERCPGVAKAVMEYLGEDGAFQVWDVETEQVVLVREPRASWQRPVALSPGVGDDGVHARSVDGSVGEAEPRETGTAIGEPSTPPDAHRVSSAAQSTPSPSSKEHG